MTEISYDVGPDDIVAFNETHMATAPAMRRQLGQVRFMGLAVFMLTAVLFVVLDNLVTAAAIAGAGLLFALIFPLILRPIARGMIRSMLGSDSKLFGRHRAVLDESGVLETTPSGENRTAWSAVERIEVTERHVFVYTSPTSALTIPRAAFPSDTAAREFIAEAERLRKPPGRRAHLTTPPVA